MKKMIAAAMVGASLFALAGCRQTTATGNESAAADNAAAPAAASADAISGTWKADLDSVKFDQKPDELLLSAGRYSCKTCVPPIDVAADGSFHPISAPYADSMAVKVVDDHSVVRTSKKGNRVVGETKLSVSADGNTLTGQFTDSSVPNASPSKGTFVETRAAAAPAGAHSISGSWKPSKLQDFNAEALTFTYKLDGDTLHMSSPAGTSFDAKLDGSDTPIKGDIAGTTASVKKTATGYQETDKRGGKIIGVANFAVGADGKLNATSEDKQTGAKISYTATKS